MSQRGYLLIAGPCHLEDLPSGSNLIAGDGAYAAIAAAPLTHAQLWTRIGSSFDRQRIGFLEDRGIDTGGMGSEGTSPADGMADEGYLPEIEPVSAEDIGATLLAGLPLPDLKRARSVITKLEGLGQAPCFVCPRRNTASADELLQNAAEADVLICSRSRAAALLNEEDPLLITSKLQEAGSKAVVLSDGAFGGLLAYKGRTTTYHALPHPNTTGTHHLAVFSGVLAAHCTTAGKADFRSIKRGLAMASAVTGTVLEPGPKKLMNLAESDYMTLFNKLRRLAKA